tara:strand:- start:50 stop:439 length:390 start_codon:yes stop_codon:yes gene_type:complete
MLDPDQDILLLDGDCGLCHGLARFIDLKLKSGVDIAYWPIESEDAQNLIATFPKWQQQSDTVYLFRDGRSYVRSAAVIRCLLYMIWHWRMWFPILWIIPLPIRNMVYRFVAKYRHRIFKKPEVCTFRID